MIHCWVAALTSLYLPQPVLLVCVRLKAVHVEHYVEAAIGRCSNDAVENLEGCQTLEVFVACLIVLAVCVWEGSNRNASKPMLDLLR